MLPLQPLDPNAAFRERRRQARRRRAIRRVSAVAVAAIAAGSVALGAQLLGVEGTAPDAMTQERRAAAPAAPPAPAAPTPRAYPGEIRGVHVTMALLSLEGKLEEYLALRAKGMNTFQLDVKDENGEVAFPSPHAPLARRIGSARSYYRPRAVVRRVHDAGMYLVGRVVVFEDPFLARARPDMAIRTTSGGVWTNYGGLGWANQYDRRVWKYNVDVAVAAARAGFDEIMFDYIRFPSDGPLETAVWPGRTNERKAETLARFLAYARSRLEPLGVRVSAAVFGLAATRDLGIGQRPRFLAPHLDAIYPMVYPSHYGPGEHGIEDPNGRPGDTVLMSLRTFRRALRGTDVRVVPWLQDFSLGRTYGLDDVTAQIESARRAGARGYLLWNAAGVYTTDALAH